MNSILKITVAVLLGWNTVGLAAEALSLPPQPQELSPITFEAAWEDATLEELMTADRLVVVAAAVGDEITLDPGFRVANVEVEDLWITDAEIARRGKGVVIRPTQVGVTRLFAANAEGWVLEYEIKVEAGVEPPELAAYEVHEDEATPRTAEASLSRLICTRTAF